MIEPVTDIAWHCVYPIRIGGLLQLTNDEPDGDPDTVGSPICSCVDNGSINVGMKVSFWEPARIIDTTQKPGCLMTIGTTMPIVQPGMLEGSLHKGEGTAYAFANMHYYLFPAWAILDLFTDLPCLDKNAQFDLAMMSEILPTWNNGALSLIVYPETILFANPVTLLACMADAAMVLAGFPRDELFWCMGAWSPAYPLTGHITSPDYTEANAAIAARGLFLMHRTGAVLDAGDDFCGVIRRPIWKKSHFKFQLMKPVRDSACMPIGRPGILWSHNKNPYVNGDNFAWMIFRKNKCCLTYY